MKKGESEFNLPKDGHKYYFFFALLGLTEIEVNYHQWFVNNYFMQILSSYFINFENRMVLNW